MRVRLCQRRRLERGFILENILTAIDKFGDEDPHVVNNFIARVSYVAYQAYVQLIKAVSIKNKEEVAAEKRKVKRLVVFMFEESLSSPRPNSRGSERAPCSSIGKSRTERSCNWSGHVPRDCQLWSRNGVCRLRVSRGLGAAASAVVCHQSNKNLVCCLHDGSIDLSIGWVS